LYKISLGVITFLHLPKQRNRGGPVGGDRVRAATANVVKMRGSSAAARHQHGAATTALQGADPDGTTPQR